MRRREFITLVGGAAIALPRVASAQDQMRRIGLLMTYTESGSEGPASIAALREGLQKLWWTEGRNIRIDSRWGALDTGLRQRLANELVALKPDPSFS